MNTDIDEELPFMDAPGVNEENLSPSIDRISLDARRKIERRKELLSLRELLNDPLFETDLE
jgi:hypothetical protein